MAEATCIGLLPGELLASGVLLVGGGLPAVCAELVGIGIDEFAILPLASDNTNEKNSYDYVQL
jgi:hypothetical protein